MNLTRLVLYGFRNLAEQRLEFGDGLQVICGGNAQGKTNLLEAIFCLTAGRSFRSADDQILVGQTEGPDEKAGYRLEGEIKRRDDTLHPLLIFDQETKRRTFTLNGAPLRRVMELWAEVKAVPFVPADSLLVKGPPLLRRQFLNRFLGQKSALYRYHLQRFSIALRHRNAILKEMQRGERGEGLETWNRVYQEVAQALVDERAPAILQLAEATQFFYRYLSRDGEAVQLAYQPSSWEIGKDLAGGAGREIAAGTCLFGPHLDELEIRLSGRAARFYSSEGEARCLALALRLAEYQILCEDGGEAPLLLLDDALSELDGSRREALLSLLEPLPQSFLTTTTIDELPRRRREKVVIFDVQDGETKKRPDPAG
ncbi:MAG: DNA replication and repair protein RecF [Coprothermobacterota bacterium]|nr:DNA replication and repair protein RecF [Coprothermobacterota bacterium]